MQKRVFSGSLWVIETLLLLIRAWIRGFPKVDCIASFEKFLLSGFILSFSFFPMSKARSISMSPWFSAKVKAEYKQLVIAGGEIMHQV